MHTAGAGVATLMSVTFCHHQETSRERERDRVKSDYVTRSGMGMTLR